MQYCNEYLEVDYHQENPIRIKCNTVTVVQRSRLIPDDLHKPSKKGLFEDILDHPVADPVADPGPSN